MATDEIRSKRHLVGRRMLNKPSRHENHYVIENGVIGNNEAFVARHGVVGQGSELRTTLHDLKASLRAAGVTVRFLHSAVDCKKEGPCAAL